MPALGEAILSCYMYISPFEQISRVKLAHCIVNVLTLAGIDSKQYKGHSTRGAATSAARNMGMNLSDIWMNSSWHDAWSFAVHYHKNDVYGGRVQRAILETRNNILIKMFYVV